MKKLTLWAALMILVIGLSACSDDESSDPTTTTTTEAPDEGDEGDGDDEDKAEAALEQIESNFGLSKKDPDDDPDEDDPDLGDVGTGLTDDEEACLLDELRDNPELLAVADDMESASGEDITEFFDAFYGCLGDENKAVAISSFTESFGFDVDPDEADCMLRTMLSDPELVEVIFSGDDPTDEQMGFTLGVIFGCMSTSSQVDFLTEALSADGALTAEQSACIAEGLVADEDLLFAFLEVLIDNSLPFPDEVAVLGTACGV